MQTASSRIWSRIPEFISYDDNHGHIHESEMPLNKGARIVYTFNRI